MRVALVHPPPHGEVPFRHIGLAYLRAVLEAEGIETVMLDLSASEAEAGTDFYEESILHLSRSVGDVSDALDPRILMEVLHPEAFADPTALSRAVVERVDARFDEVVAAGDVFLFSVNIITYYYAARLAHRLRAAGKRTAAGGPSTHFPPIRDLLLRSGAFDAVAAGEGEGMVGTLVRALARGSLEGVPSVAWIDDGGRIRSGPAAPFPDLSTLPPPFFDAREVRDFVPALASRGCTARCAYCSEPFNWERQRRRDPGTAVAEMDGAAERFGVHNFHLHDDMINGHLPWFDRFLDHLIDSDRVYRWESFCGPRGLDARRLERMRESGCVLLKMGVQSFAPETLSLMRRAGDVQELKETIVCAEGLGISMHYDMLTCFPGESEEDHRFNLRMIEEIFEETRDVFFSLNPFYLAVGSDTHLHPEKYGLTLRHFDPDTLPPALADTVRASGHHPMGFSYELDDATIRRRIAELGEILERHDRDYLYLGQSEAPAGSSAFQEAPSRGLGGGDEVDAPYVELLAPWRTGEVRGGWCLAGLSRPSGGEDGLVRYLFERSGGSGGGSVAVRLSARDDGRPCFVRTRDYNLFYDGDGSGGQEALEALLSVVVRLVRRNEVRGPEPEKPAGERIGGPQ